MRGWNSNLDGTPKLFFQPRFTCYSAACERTSWPCVLPDASAGSFFGHTQQQRQPVGGRQSLLGGSCHLGTQKLGKPPALPDDHEIESRGRSFCVQLGLNHQILQDALGTDTRRIALDRRRAARCLARIVRGLLQLVEQKKTSVPLSAMISTDLADMIILPFASRGAARTPRLHPCPSARLGVASARARPERRGIARPQGRLARAGLHGRLSAVRERNARSKARKTGDIARRGAGASGRFTLARARGGAH